MTMKRLIRSEFRKLTTTKIPLAFLAVLVVIAALNDVAVPAALARFAGWALIPALIGLIAVQHRDVV